MEDQSTPSAPEGPCFIAGLGDFSFEEDFRSQSRGTLYAVFKGYFDNMIVYDGQGNKWAAKSVGCKYKKNWWWVLLANTVYNPRIPFTILWREARPYPFSELKDLYVNAVNKDDDILTQFHSADALKEQIAQARSFGDLAKVYRWMATDHGRKDPQK